MQQAPETTQPPLAGAGESRVLLASLSSTAWGGYPIYRAFTAGLRLTTAFKARCIRVMSGGFGVLTQAVAALGPYAEKLLIAVT